MVKLFYATYVSVDLAHHELFHAKVGKGGINSLMLQGDLLDKHTNQSYGSFA